MRERGAPVKGGRARARDGRPADWVVNNRSPLSGWTIVSRQGRRFTGRATQEPEDGPSCYGATPDLLLYLLTFC